MKYGRVCDVACYPHVCELGRPHGYFESIYVLPVVWSTVSISCVYYVCCDTRFSHGWIRYVVSVSMCLGISRVIFSTWAFVLDGFWICGLFLPRLSYQRNMKPTSQYTSLGTHTTLLEMALAERKTEPQLYRCPLLRKINPGWGNVRDKIVPYPIVISIPLSVLIPRLHAR